MYLYDPQLTATLLRDRRIALRASGRTRRRGGDGGRRPGSRRLAGRGDVRS